MIQAQTRLKIADNSGAKGDPVYQGFRRIKKKNGEYR